MQVSIAAKTKRLLALSPLSVSMVFMTKPAFSAAPSVGMFGSFFPSWLICLFIGVIATVIIRAIFVVTRLDDIMQWRVPVYMSMALGLTLLFSYLFFGR